MPLYLGLSQYDAAPWRDNFFAKTQGDYLKQYASVFNCLVLKKSFFAMPSELEIAVWQEQAPRGFQLCLYLPCAISHDLLFQRCDVLLAAFFQRIKPLGALLGPIIIRLPEAFSGQNLPHLEQFLKKLPAMYAYAIEPRHEDFFSAGDFLNKFNYLLQRYHMERVNLDARAVLGENGQQLVPFALSDKTDTVVKKRLLLHFIGQSDTTENLNYFLPWQERICALLEQNKSVYLWLSMPKVSQEPQMASLLYQRLQSQMAKLADLPSWPIDRENSSGQLRLF